MSNVSLRTTLPYTAFMACGVWQHCPLQMSKIEFQMASVDERWSCSTGVFDCRPWPMAAIPKHWWETKRASCSLWEQRGDHPCMGLGTFFHLPTLCTMYHLCTLNLASIYISPCNPALIHISCLWRSQTQFIPNILGISNLFIHSAY